MLLLYGRDSDCATIVASSEVPTLPASNLQTVQPRRVWRSLSTSASLAVTYLTPVAANMLALVGGNPTLWRRVRVIGAESAPALLDSPVVDTGWVNPWAGGVVPEAPDWPSWLLAVRWENDAALSSWNIGITDEGGGISYIDIGRLMLGRAWQPGTNFDLGGTPLSYDPRDAVAETDYGFTFTDRRTKSAPRQFSLQITAARSTDVLRGLQEIQRLAGGAGDVVCCLDPGDDENFHLFGMQGRFTRAGAYGAPPMWDEAGQCWSASIELREFL